ncbi:hypothetical protein D0Z00_001149 [Geotrichum galactomycetum]|uniref:Uncharacterized protein n=1 Tax=Geotrichum galactomycetum TaxID=27317 RepID=A0ACB6V7Z0_9ASCO|nr:hypothetical protein D0Z00_001149 [Geotrichum candidum]
MSSKVIPYYNILWAEQIQQNHSTQAVIVKIAYANQTGKLTLSPETITVKFVANNELTSPIFSQPQPISDLEPTLGRTSADSMNDLLPKDVPQVGGSAAGTAEDGSIVATILNRAYANTKRNKHFLVLINPKGGPGKGEQIYNTICAPFLKLAHCETTVIVTTHRYHALEIARDTADIKKYDAVICCSGDGTPHEFVNGLAKRKGDAREALAKLALCQLPCGSGNSVANSINGNSSPTMASLGMVKGVPIPMDLMLITQDDGQYLSFLSQTFGIIADADLGTEHLRWMGGTRFVYGVLKYTLQGKEYPCDIYIKYSHETAPEIKNHYIQSLQQHHENIGTVSTATLSSKINYDQPPAPSSSSTSGSASSPEEVDLLTPRFGTINDPVPSDWVKIPETESLSIMYCGKMPWVSSDCMMFPATLPTDGTMDIFITNTSQMSRPQAIRMLAGMETGTHIDHDFIQYSKAVAYRLIPRRGSPEGNLSFDGEQFPYHAFQVELLPALGCLLTNNGMWTLTGFDRR